VSREIVAATVVVGSGLLGRSLRAQPGSKRFYALTAATAATWTAGAVASGWRPSRPGGTAPAADVVTPVATGVAIFGAFYVGGHLARRIPFADRAIRSALNYSRVDSPALVLLTVAANGLAEELFFRGALYDAVRPKYADAVSTGVYTLATASTGNPALVVAAAAMGGVFARQRRVTGDLRASVLTHLTWSALMVRYLPRLFPPKRAKMPE
jgi:uncharacterized protein